MIVVTGATPFETAWLIKQLKRTRSFGIGKAMAVQGTLAGRKTVIFSLGVGKTNAAHRTTLLLEKFTPELFLLIGCGGAYPASGLTPGDLAIASEEIFGDEGVVTPTGWKSMRYMNFPLLTKGRRKFFNRFPLDRRVVREATAILQAFDPTIGSFVTVSEVTGTRKKAEEMEIRFRAICENMEGAAVAQICTLYGAPFLEIRGISNIVKDRDKREWNISAAVRISQEAAKEIILSWGHAR